MENKNISEEQLTKTSKIIEQLHNAYKNKMVGQDNLELSLLASIISNGHILLESVPGLAKTTAAKVIANALGGELSRIQCTPDLLPSDIIGTQIFNHKTSDFETKLGPIFSNVVILDEINRSSAKTQSAMLEAMQEQQVTLGGVKHKMPNPFIVIATENPIEQEGTYLLPEAQLDRFLLKEKLNYPTVNEEIEILNRIENHVFEKEDKVIDFKDLLFLQEISEKVYVDDSIKNYIVHIIDATRNPFTYIKPELAKYIEVGASPRGTIAFIKVAKAIALINNRNYVIPEDVKRLRHSILRHRISLNYTASIDNITVDLIIDEIFASVKTP